MVDEIFDRAYQAGRADLNAGIVGGIAKLGRAIGNSFKVLNRIEYSAPWLNRTRRVRSH
ncbi:MAG: hypothetical protein ACJ8EO_00060 [Sphingomicrobium sp.]